MFLMVIFYIKGKDFVVIKNLEGQNKETLVNSVLADHFADVGFRKIIGDNRYLGLVKNIVNSKEIFVDFINFNFFKNIILFYAFFK
jgi:hypothetical protein